MAKKHTTMIAAAIGLTVAFSAAVFAQTSPDNGSGPAVVSPMQLPGTSGSPQAQVPQPQSDPGVNWKGVGVGAGTVVGNVVYIPAKLVYGILGGISGGAGWALTGGNTQVANTIWRSSLGGDYVLTPNMVAGREPIHFSGPTTTAVPPQPSVASAPQQPPSGNSANSQNLAPFSSGSSTSASAGSGAVHPIDSGAGPVSGNGTSRLSGPLPNTSVQ